MPNMLWNGWMDSEGHRANIMDGNYKSIGIGVFYANGMYYWSQAFSAVEPIVGSKPSNVTKVQTIKVADSNLGLQIPKNTQVSVGIDKKVGLSKIININTGWEYSSVQLEQQSFRWTSDNSNIAKVNDGIIEGINAGTTKIKANVGSKQITYNVNVKLPFTDVANNSYYTLAVSYCYKNKIIAGTSATTFSPNSNFSRVMLVTILWRMEGCPRVNEPSKFTDVSKSAYYYDAVQWAASKKVVNGYGNGKFRPNSSITREQLAVMLRNYANYKGKKTNIEYSLNSFEDNKSVSDFAKSAMQWAVSKKIMSGSVQGNKTMLNPKGTATRAQAAVMIHNYCLKVK